MLPQDGSSGDVLTCTLSQYRSFISHFRRRTGVGLPVASGDQVVVEVPIPSESHGEATPPASFRFRSDNLYLTHVGSRKIQLENYTQMGIGTAYTFGLPEIERALQRPCLEGSPLLAVAIVATAEAARSQVIYQVMQQVIHGKGRIHWHEDVLPLVHSWGRYTKDNHKRKPKQCGPLGIHDYYNDQHAMKAIRSLRQRHFWIEP